MKYMGSKARLAKELLPIILKDRKPGQWYVEPFAGGMNMICNVDGKRIANDNHKYLISMWKSLLSGWVPNKISKNQHKDIRENKDKYPEYIVGWAGFNCSYSGVYFGGFSGCVKTKTGVTRDYQKEAIQNVLKQVPKMKDIILLSEDYRNINIPKNSIIYCDPPYRNTSKYKTGEFDSDTFFEWCRIKHNEGHSVFISEYSAPEDFVCIWQKEFKSSLSANGVSGGSKLSTEKLFTLK